MTGPDPNKIHPNENIQQIVYIKNVITRPNIIVGEYSYYDDVNGAERFEEHVAHHYEFLGDRLIIGKFCAIARGIEFVMNGANHRMNSVSTYPFNILGGGWEAFAPGARRPSAERRHRSRQRRLDRPECDRDAGRTHWRRRDHRREFRRHKGCSAILHRGREPVPHDPAAV